MTCCFLLLWLMMCGVGCLGCDTGVAFVGQSLSLYGSSLANADVALLKSYGATDVNACMNDCCTEKYGSCTVASFKKNATDDNCRLFNCRPVQKCKFVSSASTDSFSFSSSTLPRILVPSSSSTPRHASSDNNSSSTTTTTTSTTASPSTLVALKDDNTTVVPRKGVDELKDIFSPEKSGGSKPRKGVSLEEGGKSSKVKPRKGVGPQPTTLSSSSAVLTTTPKDRQEGHLAADDLVSALEKVFEDEAKQSVAPSPVETLHPETTTVRPSSSPVDHRDVIPTTTVVHESLRPSSSSAVDSTMTTSGLLLPSLSTSLPAATTTSRVAQTTPSLQTAGPVVRTTPGVSDRTTPPTPSRSPTIIEHSRLIFHEDLTSSEESESERKYKSSMHLVLSLVVGLLILVSVLGVVAKRIYDGWMRRHYRRMDFLIDGMYNGYG